MIPPPPEAKLRLIREYAAAGFALVPLCSPTEPHEHFFGGKAKPCSKKNMGKVPPKLGWEETKVGAYPEADLAEANFGVVLPESIVVVDVDPRNFKPGDNPLKRLVADLGGAPLSTFAVRTGAAGLHLYLRKPANVPIVGKLKAYPGIDFKSVGGQVVGPFSLHAVSGKYYEVVSGSPATIADAPPALLELLKRPIPSWEGAEGLDAFNDSPQSVARYKSWLLDVAEPSVEGHQGDANAFKVACHGRDLGLSPHLTHELMVEVWNPRCSPEWDADDLKSKVVNAYKYAAGPVGSATAEADFKGAPPIPAALIDDAPPPAKKTVMIMGGEVVSGGVAVAEDDDPLGLEKPIVVDADDCLPWIKTDKGVIVPCYRNVLNYLRMTKGGLAGVFGQNDFSGRVEFRTAAPWHRGGKLPKYTAVGDRDLKMLKGWLAVHRNLEAPVQSIEEAVTVVADANTFHPVRDYLQSLKWDGHKRIETWLTDFLGVEESEFSRNAGRKTLVAAVMRVLRPGVKFDHVLILEGKQDIGKSSVIKILGGPWAADFTIDPHNRDMLQMLQGKWLVELAELDAITKRVDIAALKAFFTRTEDVARIAYGRTVTELPRQCVFIASINPGADGTYLADDENRRYWPVYCNPPGGQVDFAAFTAARDQLWAEAYVAALASITKGWEGDLFMETRALKLQAKEVVALRHAEHPWTERVVAWLRENRPTAEFVTSREIFCDAMGGIDKQLEAKHTKAIGGILRAHGWVNHVQRKGPSVVRGFYKAGGIDGAVVEAHANGTNGHKVATPAEWGELL